MGCGTQGAAKFFPKGSVNHWKFVSSSQRFVSSVILVYCVVGTKVGIHIQLRQWPIDVPLLYFTTRPLQSSTCFEHYMLIIKRLNCIDAASGIVLSVSGRPVHRLRELVGVSNQFSLNLCTGRPLTERTIPDAASVQFNLLMMSM